MSLDDREVLAWIEAGRDLGIEVVAPAVVTVASGTIQAVALVPQFGAPKGMVVLGDFRATEVSLDSAAAAVDAGYGFSYVGCTTYERNSFIDMLTDWGWVGEVAPKWLVEPDGDE